MCRTAKLSVPFISAEVDCVYKDVSPCHNKGRASLNFLFKIMFALLTDKRFAVSIVARKRLSADINVSNR
jgi:hypothetical protein